MSGHAAFESPDSLPNFLKLGNALYEDGEVMECEKVSIVFNALRKRQYIFCLIKSCMAEKVQGIEFIYLFNLILLEYL